MVRRNLVCNPSAEGGAETTKVATVVAAATLNGFSGSSFNVETGLRSFFMQATGTGAGGTALMEWLGLLVAPNANRTPVVAGKEYTATAVGCFIVDKPAAGQRFIIIWTNAAGAVVSVVSGSPVAAAGSQVPPPLTATAPPGAVACRFGFGNLSNLASGEVSTFWIDGLMLTAEPGDYFDGDTPGYRWDGTPYSSPSSTIPIHVRETPPLWLAHEITDPSGRRHRWADDEADPANVPSGVTFSSVMPGGFDTAQAVLPRKPGIDYGDQRGFADWKVYGAGGEVVSETRLERSPRVSGDQVSISPDGVGWQAYLEDDKTAREIFRDIDLGRWQEASRARQHALLGVPGVLGSFQTAADAAAGLPALSLAIEGAWTRRPFAEAWYDAGAGCAVAKVWYDLRAEADLDITNAAWNVFPFASDADDGTGLASGSDLQPGGNHTGTFTPAAAKRFAGLQLNYQNAAAGSASSTYKADIRRPVVYGAHGLPVYGTEPAAGLLASDIAPYVLGRWAPLLNFTTGPNGSISPSSFPIPQLAFYDPTTVKEILTQAIRFGLPDWAVWDNRTFYLHPRGARGRKWRFRVGPGQLQETGQAMDRVWNGILVRYQDVDGSTRTVGPPGSGADVEDTSLLVDDPLNPANQAGIKRWDMLDMGMVSVSGAAIEVGRVFLEQANQLDRSGQAIAVGYAMDDRGILRPASQIRAGDSAAFVDASDSSERRIVRVQYDHSTRTASLDLDAPPEALSALLERLSVDLVRIGVS